MQDKICIISSTSRENSVSIQIAHIYKQKLEAKGIRVELIDLNKLPHNLLQDVLYKDEKTIEFQVFQDLVVSSNKFLFVVPEYNGSFPGILKTFIDCLNYQESFYNKKGAMIGLSSGSQGGALAMAHLADILSYLGMNVLADRPRLFFINNHLENNTLSSELYMNLIDIQIDKLLAF